MGCCLSTPVDFEGEVNLYHFDLHRVVGKGAFGKVSISPGPRSFLRLHQAVSPEPGGGTKLGDCRDPFSVAFVPPSVAGTCLRAPDPMESKAKGRESAQRCQNPVFRAD